MVRIVLVEDHQIVREGLRAILEKEGLQIVGEAADGRQAIELVETMKPDVVVMDVSMPNLNGIDATKKLTLVDPKVKVIGLSMNSDRRYVLEMLGAGAVGYLVKSGAADELVLAVGAVMAGKTYLSPHISGVVVDALRHPNLTIGAKTLSIREREVLQLLAEGHTSKDIAHQLSVAVSTIETHRKQIMSKLGLHSIAELTKYAVREGLTSLD